MSAGALLAGRQEAEEFLEERRAYEDTRLQTLLNGLVAVLERFYYLDRAGEKTAKAARLMDMFDTNALMISEMVEGAYLQGFSAPDVAEVFSWFAYDRDVEFRNRNLLPGPLVQLRRRLDDLQRDIFGAERRHDLMITTGYNTYFYGVVRAWCRGATMADLLGKVELSEGDIVMAMTKTLDVMRQVREMLLRHDPDGPLTATLREADGLLRRGVVQMVNSIGFVQSKDVLPGEGAAPAGRASSGFEDVDRMLGLLADPNAPPPVIHPPDTGLQRPERPSRFAPGDRPRDRPPTFGGSRERGGAPRGPAARRGVSGPRLIAPAGLVAGGGRAGREARQGSGARGGGRLTRWTSSPPWPNSTPRGCRGPTTRCLAAAPWRRAACARRAMWTSSCGPRSGRRSPRAIP